MVCALTIIVSCTKETPNGVKYTVIRSGDGNVAKEGQVVIMDVSIRDKNDSAWFDSKQYGMPEMVMIRHDSFKETEFGIMELFRLISPGDSVSMTVTAREFFENTWKTPVPPSVDPADPFTFHVKTTQILDSIAAITLRDQLERERREKFDREMAEQAAGQIAVDTTMIDEHLANLNVKPLKTKSGMRYIIKKKGKGDPAGLGQVATVKYNGYLLNGTVFDSGVYSFPVGFGQVIQGWDEIVTLMNPGTSLTVYIPSTLAYGNQRRSQEIMENTILVFDMELQEVRNQ